MQAIEQEQIQDQLKETNRAELIHNINALILGIGFGIILIKSEVASWFRIQSMFHFEEAHMYLIISSAIVVGIISVQLIKFFNVKTITDNAIEIKSKDFHKGIMIGGLTFGMGWTITGACPGPIYAQIGSGELIALITFVGAIAGMYLYAWLKPFLPH